MVKSIWEFIGEGLGGIVAIIFILTIFGFTSLGFSITLNIIFILAIIYLVRNPKKEEKTRKKPTKKFYVGRGKGGMIIPKRKTPSSTTLIDRTILIVYKHPQIFCFNFKKGTKLIISIESDNPVDLYLLDKWHVDRETTWYDFEPNYQGIVKLTNEERIIPKDGRWFLVFDACQDEIEIKINVVKENP